MIKPVILSSLAAAALMALAACQVGTAAPGPKTAATPGGSGPIVASRRAQAEAHYLLAQAEEAQGNLLAAAEGYETALGLDSWSDPLAETPLAGLARICESGGEPQAVIRACGAAGVAFRFEPARQAAFQARRAEALLQLGEVDRARSAIEAAEQLDSGRPEVLLIRGRVEEAAGEPAAALRSYTLTLFRQRGWPEAHLARGRLRAALRDDTGALEDFDAVLSDPEGVAAHPDAYRDRAMAHCHLSEPEQAAVDWQVWANLVPNGSADLNKLLQAAGYLSEPPAEGNDASALAAWVGDGCPGAEPRQDATDSVSAKPAAEPEPAPPAARPADSSADSPGASPAGPAVNPG